MVYRETFTLLLFVVSAVVSQELLSNGGFDDPTNYLDSWSCTRSRANCTPSNDALSETTSVLVSERQKPWSGIFKDLPINLLEDGKRYSIEGWIKLLITNGETKPTRTRLLMSYQLGASTWKTEMISELYITPGEGWVQLTNDFARIDPGANSFLTVRLAIHVGDNKEPSPYPDFIADSFSLSEITDFGWKVAAEQRIEAHRKSNLGLTMIGGSKNKGYVNATVVIKQLYSEFGFGSAVDAFLLEKNEAYRKTFVENFQWGNIEGDTRWRLNEYTTNARTWESVDQEMKILEKNGIRVRGGNIHEARIDSMRNPDFIRHSKIPDDIYMQSMKRVDDILGRYRYRCQHWNVVNNMFTTQRNSLSQAYRSDQINIDLYRRAKDVDYAAKLYLNEESLLTDSPEIIQKIIHGVKQMNLRSAPIDGIGLEVKTDNLNSPSTSILINRLSRIGKAGVSVWLNNFRYSNPDKTARATFLDDFITAAMSERKVGGIMLDNFWDGIEGNDDSALFEGEDFTPNAAGVALRDRIAEVTSLNKEVFTFDIEANERVTVPVQRLYHGVYEVTVESDDKVVTRRTIPLLSGGGDVSLDVWF